MSKKAYLVLQNGAVFEGKSFGAEGDVTGELVFATSMTGYLETLTDPSYYGQIVLQTFPLIGNYGMIPSDFESQSIGMSAYIVRYPCQDPSNFRNEGTLDTFLRQKNVVGLCGIDTRAVTKMIREQGVMNGRITCQTPDQVDLTAIRNYKVKSAVEHVSVKKVEQYKASHARYQVALLDFGLKQNMERELTKRGCDVWRFPYDTPWQEIQAMGPDGILLSNGPGDPKDNPLLISRLRQMIKEGIPIFGICLGHQLLALANDFETCKLSYGHRGSNQPVKDLKTGKLYITSQNHGYAVDSKTIDPKVAEQWFVNVNDRSCEGILYKHTPIMSVQFHPEACAGPLDTNFLFDVFIERMEGKPYAIG